MKFREHRGGLAEAMDTVIEVVDRDALLKHVQEILSSWPDSPPVTAATLQVIPYCYDDRIGWDTHIVTLDKYGVIGFTDGPA